METNDYCSYNLSLALKKAGFFGMCDMFYSDTDKAQRNELRPKPKIQNEISADMTLAPTLYQAQKWLRSKGIDIEPHMELVGAKRKYRLVLLPIGHEVSYGKLHPSYEEALEAGIEAALIIIEIDKDNRRYKK